MQNANGIHKNIKTKIRVSRVKLSELMFTVYEFNFSQVNFFLSFFEFYSFVGTFSVTIEFSLICFGCEENHEANCKVAAVVLVLDCRSAKREEQTCFRYNFNGGIPKIKL